MDDTGRTVEHNTLIGDVTGRLGLCLVDLARIGDPSRQRMLRIAREHILKAYRALAAG